MLALGNGFVWLDHLDVESGAATAPLGDLWRLFLRGYGDTGFYRPFTALTLSLDAAVGAPWVFHAQNLAWHTAATLALAAAILAVGSSRFVAVVAATIFAVHPLASPVVNGILFRPELLLATALFVVLWAHATERPIVALAAMLLGGLSKETALVLGPAFIGVVVVWGGRARPPVRLLVAEGLGWASAVGLRVAFAPAWRLSGPELSLLEGMATRLGALARSGWQFVAPVRVPICDATPVLTFTSPLVWTGALVGVGVIAWAAIRRGPALLLALSLLPSLSLVPVPRFWSAHYLYVPLAFFAWLVAERLVRLPRNARWACLPVAAALAVGSLIHSTRWRDDLTLFAPELAANPSCTEAAFYVAEAKRAAGDLEGAAGAYTQAATPAAGVLAYADVPGALQNLALVRLQQGHLDAAEAALRRAKTYPLGEAQRRELTHNEAVIAVRRKDWERVELLLRQETARPDAKRESLLLRARALHELGQFDQSRALLERLGINARR